MEALFLLVGAMGLMVVGLIYGAFAYGFVVYKMWYWFLTPVFTTLPHISLYQAIGIGLFIGLFRNSMSPEYEFKGETLKEKTKWGTMILFPWFTLGAAYLIKCVFL
jgi:hypothetical protein